MKRISAPEKMCRKGMVQGSERIKEKCNHTTVIRDRVFSAFNFSSTMGSRSYKGAAGSSRGGISS